jgi:hypothetical protein
MRLKFMIKDDRVYLFCHPGCNTKKCGLFFYNLRFKNEKPVKEIGSFFRR